ncbi:hypothetical protein I302_100085 [Kwoniella bestiolae CBS 10118]|uniref:Uncharacterized protein n=1 Tax=Kwoniella bestiolae CBS 10118 TaxID=1296100 RepID=A0A1B9G426_9TREE|nr:hypothetical protein I302_03457 [Kwoniella bestiolae CBS 10118]OCF25784.1 hypothetical protein I302_03457 [Kwoniella bestiolae CBS 10118]
MAQHDLTLIGNSLPLPPELISLTLHFLKSTADTQTLHSLVQCSKALYQELIPTLYRNITLDKHNSHFILQGLGKVDEETVFGIYDTHNNSLKRYFSRSLVQRPYLHIKPLRRKLTLLSHVESLVLEDLQSVKAITGVL